MFSFIRWIYRRFFIYFLLYYYNFVEFVSSFDDKGIFHESTPFKTIAALYAFAEKPYSVAYLIHPLASRCSARKFGDHYLNVEEMEENCIEELNETSRPKVLVCHDMAGGYRGDRFVTGSKKFDDYRFYHWSGIDIINYFTHAFITIPPISWINAAHRHGVIVLGTFITEGGEGVQNLNVVLQSEQSVGKTVEALILTTKNFGFDGWLINIESGVAHHQVPLLKLFCKLLTTRIHEEIPHGMVIWYDSVTENGYVSWQNAVTKANKGMYEGTDGILLNYWWNDDSLKSSAEIVNHNPIEMQKVFVGIDVFGRNQVAKFHTHETLRKIKDYNFSVAIFAPGWTFENMPDMSPWGENGKDDVNIQFLTRDAKFWGLLWKYLYARGPNKLPFYTSFCIGSGKRQFRDGLMISNEAWFNLMEQEYQPSVPSTFTYHFEEAYRGGSCIKFTDSVQNIRLFVTDFACKNDIVMSFVYKRTDPQINVKLVLNVEDHGRDKNILVYCDGDGESADIKQSKKKPCEHFLIPLSRDQLRTLLRGLALRDEKTFPSTSAPVNGWETRYFYLNFENEAQLSRIVDIGISVHKNRWNETDSVLLGGVHIHNGIENDGKFRTADKTITFANWGDHTHKKHKDL